MNREKEFKDILTSFNDINIFKNRILSNLLKNNSIVFFVQFVKIINNMNLIADSSDTCTPIITTYLSVSIFFPRGKEFKKFLTSLNDINIF